MTTLNELHKKLEGHLNQQSENWDSFIYAQEKGFYQGFDAIEIDGCRSTEQRFEQYNIQKYLSKKKSALDIGSNCGFFSLCVLLRTCSLFVNPDVINLNYNYDFFLQLFVSFLSSRLIESIYLYQHFLSLRQLTNL